MINFNKYASPTAFTDLLFNIVIGVAFMFMLAFLLINPVAKKQDIDKRKYEDLMQSTFDQLLDSLGYSFDEILGATKLEDLFWPEK